MPVQSPPESAKADEAITRPSRHTASLLAFATDAMRNESKHLLEQAQRVSKEMERAVPVMREARERIRALESDLSEALAALREIGEQKTLEELSEAGEDCEGDFEGAYEIMIERARAILAKHKDSTHDK